MTFEEMNQRAAKRELAPEGLMPSERIAYLTLCMLYGLVNVKRMTKEDAVLLKNRAESEFERDKAREHEYVIGATATKLLMQSTSPEAKRVLEELGYRP